MSQHKQITPESHLNLDVQRILEVPPKWCVRNGGYLMLAYVALIYLLFTLIEISPVLFSKVTIGEHNRTYRQRSIAAKMILDRNYVVSLKTGAKVHLKINLRTPEYYLAYIKYINKNSDSTCIGLIITENDNKKYFNKLQSNSRYEGSMQVPGASIMSGILQNTLKW